MTRILWCIALFAWVPAASAVTIVNPSFEDPVLAPGDSVNDPVGAGWQWAEDFPNDGGGWSIEHLDGSNGGLLLDGNNAAILQRNGYLYQELSPGEFVPGAHYELSFDLLPAEEFNVFVSVGDLLSDVNRELQLSEAILQFTTPTFTTYMFDFVLQSDFDPDSDTIWIYFLNPNISSGPAIIDNVSITLVPVPAAGWLLASALAILGIGRRLS